MGVRKSQAAPMATAMRNGSGLWLSLAAKLAAIGAITRTVAALLRNGVTAMAAARIRASAPAAGNCAAAADSHPAIRSVPPVVRRESLTGMRAPSMTRIGQSITWQASRKLKEPASSKSTAAPKNATVTGTR